ncbi:MAG: hypothetical protein ACR2K1_02825, partial [Saprospiraceae bacterium]
GVTIQAAGINTISETTNTNGGTIVITGTEVDGSATNEGSLTVGAGTATTSIIQSNTSGSPNVTLEAGSNITLTETGNTITIAATGGGGLSGSGTTNTIPKFTASTTLGNSLFTDDGSVTAAGGTAAFRIPNGTTGERPSTALNGQIRYNTTNSALEYFDGAWEVPLLSASQTGLGASGKLFLGDASGKATFSDSIQYSGGVFSINPSATSGTTPFQVTQIVDGVGTARGIEVRPPVGFTGRALPFTVNINDNRSLSAGNASVNVTLNNNDATNNNYSSFGFLGTFTSGGSGTFGTINCIYTDHNITTSSADISIRLRDNNVVSDKLIIKSSGNVGIGVTAPTAALHLKAGTATANSAPLKFTSGTNLTTAEAGAMEYNGTNLLFTPSTVRHTVNHGLTGSATLDFPSTTAQTNSDLTITVTGASDGDVVSLGVPNAAVTANTCFTAWVSAANTVTVRFNNYSTGTANPASATFKVFITK